MRPTVGEVLHAGEAERLDLVEKGVHPPERIGAVDPGQHRRALDDRQHLARHLDHDGIGVAVGEQAGERAAARHAITAGIIDDDKVDAARLLAFRREADARAAADNRLATRRHGPELIHERRPVEGGHR